MMRNNRKRKKIREQINKKKSGNEGCKCMENREARKWNASVENKYNDTESEQREELH